MRRRFDSSYRVAVGRLVIFGNVQTKYEGVIFFWVKSRCWAWEHLLSEHAAPNPLCVDIPDRAANFCRKDSRLFMKTEIFLWWINPQAF